MPLYNHISSLPVRCFDDVACSPWCVYECVLRHAHNINPKELSWHCFVLQMWNSIFWPCMSETRCVDKSVDDVSFLSYVIRNMQQLLPGVPIKSQVAVSGYSNGGMMIQTLLCKQPDIANHLAGVALIGTMMGSDFASSSCKQNLPRSLPLVWVHGLKDPVLPYSAGSSLGVRALGAGERLLHVHRCYSNNVYSWIESTLTQCCWQPAQRRTFNGSD